MGESNFYTQFHHSFSLSLLQTCQAAAPIDTSDSAAAAADAPRDGAVAAAPAASAAAVGHTPAHDRVGRSAATSE